MKRALLFLLFALPFLCIQPAFGHSPEITAGISFLSISQTSDGSWGDPATSTESLPATAAVLESLQVLAETGSAEYTKGLAWLQGQSLDTSDYLAQRITVSGTGTTDVNLLLSHVDDLTSAWGGHVGYETNNLDTVQALRALWGSNHPDINVRNAAQDYLVSTQNAAGGWGLTTDNDSSLYLTALISQTLQLLPATLESNTAVSLANDYLETLQNPDGGFGEPASTTFETASAYLALAPLFTGATASENSVRWLTDTQELNGSWENDPFATALALRALQLVDSTLPNPDFGAISGIVFETQTGLPLAGVTVSISGTESQSQTTSDNGAFKFMYLPAGSYVVEISMNGYIPIHATTSAIAGKATYLGTLQLLKEQGNDTGTIQGIIIAGDSDQPLEGASVTVIGVDSLALTLADGAYQVVNVPAGTVTIIVEKEGYSTSTTAREIAANGLMLHSRSLLPIEAPTTAIQGAVTDGLTGSSLTGVEITLSGSTSTSVITDTAGSFHVSGLIPGGLTVIASLPGYDSAGSSFSVYANNIIEFSPKLYPTGNTPPGDVSFNVRGKIVDLVTYSPLQNATVTATFGDELITASTDYRGVFSFTTSGGLHGSLEISQAGYNTNTVSVILDPIETNTLSTITMHPEGLVIGALPDLVANSIDTSGIASDSPTLQLTGVLAASVTNQGNKSAPGGIDALAFYDTNSNGRYDVNIDLRLGQARTSNPLDIDSSETVIIPLNAVLPYRDAPIAVWIDSGQAVVEHDEINNIISNFNNCPQPDLTAALLSVIDHGTGQSLGLSVRVGNGGAAPLEDSTTVSFYEGNPTSGTLLGSVSISNMAVNNYQDITLEQITGMLSGNDDLFAVVDPENQVAECDDNNNITSAAVPQLWPDLAVTDIKFIEHWANPRVSLELTVVNKGLITSPDQILVALYRGNPITTDSVFLGSTTVGSIEPGGTATVAINNVSPSSPGTLMYGVVDADDSAFEYDECNNTVSIATPWSSLAVATIKTNKYFYNRHIIKPNVFGPNETVPIFFWIDNPSGLAADYRIKISILDSSLNLVEELGEYSKSLGPYPTYGTKYYDSWNAQSVLAGKYYLWETVTNADGDLIAEDGFGFTIEHPASEGPALSLNTTVEPATAGTSDSVLIHNMLQNTTDSVVIDNTLLRVQVTRSGQEVFRQDSNIGQLLPGALLETTTPYTFEDALSGTYDVSCTAFDSQTNAILASAQGSFTVGTGDADHTQGITGSIELLATEISSGKEQISTALVTNANALLQSDKTIKQTLVRLDGEQTVNSTSSLINTLEPGETKSVGWVIDTTGLELGGYATVLQLQYGLNEWLTLGYAAFEVIEGNQPPVAVAGVDQTVAVGDTVILDGYASSDIDDDPLTYLWSVLSRPEGSTSQLADANDAIATLVADKKGIYTVQLVVNDLKVDSEPSVVSITALNTKPVANAGLDQAVYVGDTFTLDASGSTDTDGDALTYHWILVDKPLGSLSQLSDPSSVMPTITIDSHGSYTVQLLVNDGSENSEPDLMLLSVENVKPVAAAGPDQAIYLGETVTLDGSASFDADGDPLTYQWAIISSPWGNDSELSDSSSVMPTIIIDSHGSYVVELTVNDGYDSSEPDRITLDVMNIVPVADAGRDQAVYVGDTATLNGSNSSDADGDPLTYHWSILNKPQDSLSELSDPSISAPSIEIDGHGIYIMQLLVNDGLDNSEPDTVVLNVLNIRPVADAGGDQHAWVGEPVNLDGSASSDADGDPLSYNWSLTSVPANSEAYLADPYSLATDFVPDQEGIYISQLIVNDGIMDSEPDTMSVTAEIPNEPPVCDYAAANLGSLWPPNHDFATIGIVGVTDPDNDPLTLTITTVTQDEPVNGPGDGDTGPDAIVDGENVLIRSERSGKDNGRVYAISFKVDDGRGGLCAGTVKVGVPHSKKKGSTAIDDGQLYDSTEP